MGNITKKFAEVASVKNHVQQIQILLRDVMKPDFHYGTIPGCGEKKVLFKAGAEYLSFMFRLTPEFQVERIDLENGHREYSVVCILRSIETGLKVSEGLGSCSTMESKYRYQTESDYEVQDIDIPKDYKEKKREYQKSGFGAKMVNNAWVWVRYKDARKVEVTDIADKYNTVLKMAKKRAFVDANITASAASDIFTQDMDEETVKEYRSQSVPTAEATDPEETYIPNTEPTHKQEPEPEKEGGTLEEIQYNFYQEMLDFFKEPGKVSSWLQENSKFTGKNGQEYSISSTTQIRSIAQCNVLKGKFRKFRDGK